MKILVTGSSGLIGSAAVRHFDGLGHDVVGADNNLRATFFGEQGDTTWCREQLLADTIRFRHVELDIRDRQGVEDLFEEERFDAVIHCAAQPSHDRAADIPHLDFEVNALGTLNLLQANRRFSLDSPFIFMSTNKVYGDGPNNIPLDEQSTRYEYADPGFANGIPETFSIDHCKHSLFGASKVAADVMVQEYGRYFGMPTCCLRGGCLTGPAHSAVELHGFLSYLIKCNLTEKHYTVFGYKGKQVRDNIHSDDVVRFMHMFIEQPRSGAVYNIGGGKANSISILETFDRVSALTGKPMQHSYRDANRIGDHICYYSDLSRIRADFPGWNITINLDQTIEQIVHGWTQRIGEEVQAS